MKKYVILIIVICISVGIVNFCLKENKINENEIISNAKLQFSPKTKYNDCYFIYVDYTRPLNEERLFIIDFGEIPCIIYSSMVAHGYGKNSTSTKVVLSNEINSNCSSKGLYSLSTIRKFDNFRDCIELDGLSETNNNARKRHILIHPSWYIEFMPCQYFFNIPLTKSSKGCIATDFDTTEFIIYLLKHSNKPILMYVNA